MIIISWKFIKFLFKATTKKKHEFGTAMTNTNTNTNGKLERGRRRQGSMKIATKKSWQLDT